MSQNIYVGVDWHKQTSTWVAINEQREKIYCRSWKCTPEDVHAAISSLPAVPENIMLGIEPVCGWRWMTQICAERNVDARIANPKRLREIAETGKKTDKNDAATIAELLRVGYLPEAYRAPDAVYRLRTLVRQRGFLVRISTAIKCRVHGVCTALGEHVTARQPLRKDSRARIAAGGNTELARLYACLDDIIGHIASVEQEILQETKHTKIYKILTSIPGIGPLTAVAICAEVGDFKRFPTSASLISYAGIYPREHSSGERQRYGRIAKIGSRVLRYSIIEAAMRVRDTATAHNLYTHYEAAKNIRKKTPKQARIVLAHKMLTIAWHLAHRDALYDDRAVKSAQREMTS